MITPYKFHQFCTIFPRCTDVELQLLVSDVRENGLRTPIVLYEGQILDGRNRYLACQMLNREPDYVHYKGDDPLAFVISQNLCRRHLSESQRALVAAAIIELRRNDAGHSDITVADAAKKLNVSERLVYHAEKVMNEGTEQDVLDILSGEKRVRTVSTELAQAEKFTLSSVDPKKDRVKELEQRIFSTARGMRRDMDEMFTLTRWNDIYKKLHRELRTIIFDE